MKPKNKLSVLITIIVLMVIFIPSAVYGTITHFTSTGIPKNPTYSFYNKGYLYFYQEGTNNLIGTYKCQNKLCDYAYETLDDSNYAFKYYNDNSIDQIELINNKYAFIIDSDGINIEENYSNLPITLYDIINNQIKVTLTAVKNYSVGTTNGYYIARNTSNLWGIIKINNDVKVSVPYQYDYIGISSYMKNNTLASNTFVVSQNSKWKIIDYKDEARSIEFDNQIVDYNDSYIGIKKEDLSYIYDYNGNQKVLYGFKDMKFYETLVGVMSSANEFYIIDPNTGLDQSKRYKIEDIDVVTYTRNGENIELDINGEKETIKAPEMLITNETDEETTNNINANTNTNTQNIETRELTEETDEYIFPQTNEESLNDLGEVQTESEPQEEISYIENTEY